MQMTVECDLYQARLLLNDKKIVYEHLGRNNRTVTSGNQHAFLKTFWSYPISFSVRKTGQIDTSSY